MSLLQVDVKKGKTVCNLMDTPFPALDDYADAGIFPVRLIDARTVSYVQSLVLLSATYNVPTALLEERACTFQDALDKLFEDQSEAQNTEYLKALEKLLANYCTTIWGVSGASGTNTVVSADLHLQSTTTLLWKRQPMRQQRPWFLPMQQLLLQQQRPLLPWPPPLQQQLLRHQRQQQPCPWLLLLWLLLFCP